MATVNYSVPDGIKKRFNQVFAGQNKSQIIAGLMEYAVAEREREQERAQAIDALLKLRGKQKSMSEKRIRIARHYGRP